MDNLIFDSSQDKNVKISYIRYDDV